MSDTPEQQPTIHSFALVVDGEVAQVIGIMENAEATIAALNSNPKVVPIPSEIADIVSASSLFNPWSWDGEKFIAPES